MESTLSSCFKCLWVSGLLVICGLRGLHSVVCTVSFSWNTILMSFWNQISAMNTIISSSFCFPGHVPRSSSMAMWAMRVPMAKHHLKTQCMTPTWSLLRLKQSDSIPLSIQSARWYSPTSLLWTSILPVAVCGMVKPNREERTNSQFELVTMSSLCCSMLVLGQHNLHSNAALLHLLPESRYHRSL